MDDLPEWAGELDEVSDFDRDSSDDDLDDREDPESFSAAEEGSVPEEADAADVAEQAIEVPADEDDEARAE
ncbi:hypothetical protein [Glycomyces salinus]|uniref:hypothetical protein n=1 Tax=Glycomyces salinus TaxID=980294 RepID=UPI0018EC14C5|nr:hypothetical protein [Glycomyces salinus]